MYVCVCMCVYTHTHTHTHANHTGSASRGRKATAGAQLVRGLGAAEQVRKANERPAVQSHDDCRRQDHQVRACVRVHAGV